MAPKIVRFVVVPTGIVLCALFVLALWWEQEPELAMPVEGFTRTQVRSSFGAPRDGGRRQHHGIDLFASTGTPVCAATSGVIVFKGWNHLGGRAVYVFGEGILTYYAHLDSWRPGLHLGERVVRGTRLGAVGTSGNAIGTPPHLHFAVHPLWNRFAAVDPAPRLLWAAAAARDPEVASEAPPAATNSRQPKREAVRVARRRQAGPRHVPPR